MTPKTMRGASTSAQSVSRSRTTHARSSRAVRSARHAFTVLVSMALASTPIHLGQIETSSDAAMPVVSRPLPTDAPPRLFIRERASRSGWAGRQWRCIDAIVYRESRWHPTSKNSHSSAYGLFQILHTTPGTSLAKQYAAFEDYITSRYGTPCQALRFHTANGWY